MNVPHLIVQKPHSIVVTTPICESGAHDVCGGGGLYITETNLLFFHIQWHQSAECPCLCHLHDEE